MLTREDTKDTLTWNIPFIIPFIIGNRVLLVFKIFRESYWLGKLTDELTHHRFVVRRRSLTSFPCEYFTDVMHHWVTNNLFMCPRPGTPLHDDATPPDSSQPAPSLCHHGDEPDEPPQHHCQHGCCSTGPKPPLQNGHLCYKGRF